MTKLEGSRLSEGNFSYYSEGSYGAVFVNSEKTRIRKIALKKANVSPEDCLDARNSEIEAIMIAQSSKILSPLVACPFEIVENIEVLNASGHNISDKFYTDKAFEAAYIPGKFQKIGEVISQERDDIEKLFWDESKLYTGDADVLLLDGKIKKIVDFSTKEIVVEC